VAKGPDASPPQPKEAKAKKKVAVVKVDDTDSDAPPKGRARKKTTSKAPVTPTEPAVALRRGRQPVNPETVFTAFVSRHRVKSLLEGVVRTFTSHGAVIDVAVGSATVECYAPNADWATPLRRALVMCFAAVRCVSFAWCRSTVTVGSRSSPCHDHRR
jgi:hypothetical protein